MLDTRTVEKGFTWEKDHLPSAKVIFITEHDPYDMNLPMYHVERCIREMGRMPFGDLSEIVYVNASHVDGSPLGRLMHDMQCKKPADMYYAELSERAKYFKTNEHGVTEMCEVMEKLANEKVIQSNQKTLLKLFKRGFSVHDIADIVEWTEEQVKQFLHSRNLRPSV